MKNILKLFLGLSLAFAVVACDTENVGTIFEDASSSDVTFVKISTSYIFGAEDPDQVVVDLSRGVATEAYTPAITCDNDLFTVTVAEFAVGSFESTATISFDRNNLEVGATNIINLALANHSIEGQQLTHELSIVRDFVWLDYGTTTMYSYFLEWGFGIVDMFEIPVIKVEGMGRYRIIDPYLPVGATEGCYIEFDYKDGAIVFPGDKDSYGDNIFNVGLDVGYGVPIHLYLNEGDCEYKDNVLTFKTAEHYMPGVGGYGDFLMTFTFPQPLE